MNKSASSDLKHEVTAECLRGCLCGGELALFVGLALVRGLNFSSLVRGTFLALLAGLDLARMRYRKASPSNCVYMENFKPF